jgi:hypothetical protein
MIGKTKKAVVERSTKIGRGRAEDETGVVQGEMGFRLREETAVQVCQRLDHFLGFGEIVNEFGTGSPLLA